MSNEIRVFVVGPMHGTHDERLARFAPVVLALERAGYRAVTPVPALSGRQSTLELLEAVEEDMNTIRHSHHVVVLPGTDLTQWEIHYARTAGIPVVTLCTIAPCKISHGRCDKLALALS